MNDLSYEQNPTVSFLVDKTNKFANAEQLKKILHPNTAANAPSDTASDGFPSAERMAAVLDRVRDAAVHIREIEDRAREQEFRTQQLIDQMRSDVQAACSQAQAAEQRTREIQIQANALIKAAEDRARAAEDRAKSAEGWLRCIAEAIESEFAPGSAEAAAIRSSLARAAAA